MSGYRINSYSWGDCRGWLRDAFWDTGPFISLIAAESALHERHFSCLHRALDKNSLYHGVSDIQIGGNGLAYFTYRYDHDPRLVRIVQITESPKPSPIAVLRKIKAAFDSNLIGCTDRINIGKRKEVIDLQILIEDALVQDSFPNKTKN